MTDFWTTVLDFAQDTTARVGTQLLKDFGHVQAAQKPDGSLVTQADKWADREIQDAIASTFDGYGILSEEGDHIFPDREWCWVIDPLDGTTNFTRGIPIWAISLGLLYRGTPVFGYIYLPPLAQSFHGFWPGSSGLTTPTGAFLNHHPIYTSTDSPSSNHFFNLCSRSTSVIQKGFPCKIRMLGVASYNFLTVAAGATLGGVEASPKIWDIAAAWAIVQAAGGTWVSLKSEPVFPLVPGTDYGDRPYPTLAVSRSELVPVFQPFLHSVKR
ncbi:inositol monophosphatase family protein [Chroococcidiopsis sp. CCMEE 29]|uniref:inositol monophosphatase family protein n=1 Tax=Chroococcidiopsis sp. CCMEE 29 TaxID=155894 RepID=UPI002020278A|nr:inositol monophosphatase family protein [Chroococcidiopsis sp. CCMEE 29]